MARGQSSPNDLLETLIRRETLRLILLIAVAVAALAGTRRVADANRHMHLASAAEWYRRGQQSLAAGELTDAVGAFRRASIRKRDDKTYALALARALARSGDEAGAARALLALRETAPEDADINLELARLAAVRGDITTAARYYYNALYAHWTTPEAPRAIRFELIDLLLAHGERARAQSELLAVATDLPADSAAHVNVARLFMAAGNPRRALDQFTSALEHDAQHQDALAGAGIAAFELGEFVRARQYFRALTEDRDDVGQRPEIASLVIASDPLAPRLGAAERRRRLATGLEYAQQRLDACIRQSGDEAPVTHAALRDEAEAFRARLRSDAAPDADALEAGVDVVARILTAVDGACGGATPRDEALRLIGRRYGGPGA